MRAANLWPPAAESLDFISVTAHLARPAATRNSDPADCWRPPATLGAPSRAKPSEKTAPPNRETEKPRNESQISAGNASVRLRSDSIQFNSIFVRSLSTDCKASATSPIWQARSSIGPTWRAHIDSAEPAAAAVIGSPAAQTNCLPAWRAAALLRNRVRFALRLLLLLLLLFVLLT